MSKFDLIDVIHEDCSLWQYLKNKNSMFYHYMYLNECKDSKESGLYQLILDGTELWYGTLQEINAIVKSMCALLTNENFTEM